MTIILTSEKIINRIQQEFTDLFPYLRIDFFIKTNYKSKVAISKLSQSLSLGVACKAAELLTVEISPYTTVKDFEEDLEKKFGLYAQLYRKSGNMWQEITVTDTWTMSQQDKTGREISAILNTEFEYQHRKSLKKSLIQKAV